MVTKFVTTGVLLLLYLSTTFGTCKGGAINCGNTTYSFQITGKIEPDKSTINIGDTIWLSVNAPTIFIDLISSQNVNYEGASNLGTAIGFGQIFGKDSITDAANSFSFYLLQGKAVNNPSVNKIREYVFVQINNRYQFKLGIIPKKSGTFGIGLSNANNVYRNSDACTKASFNVSLENTKQHYYLNPSITPLTFDTTKPSGSYFFTVL